jgi:hypothetical protein
MIPHQAGPKYTILTNARKLSQKAFCDW